MKRAINKIGKVIFTGKTKQDREIVVRYPRFSDAERMLHYINELSQERTYVRHQGEQLSLKEEKSYLRFQLKKISEHLAIQLLVFFQDLVIGIASIEMHTYTERHTGIFSISVQKDFREEGIGSLLMELIIAEAVEHISELKIVTLLVFASNTVGYEIYKKAGFVEYGRLPEGIKRGKDLYEDGIFMYKMVR